MYRHGKDVDHRWMELYHLRGVSGEADRDDEPYEQQQVEASTQEINTRKHR
jgi:hypothetical protein